MRLIDADAFNSWLEGYAREYVLGKRKISITNILEHVRDMSTIQTKCKRGRWFVNGDIPKECPFCGEDWDKYVFGDIWYTGELPKFCPNCGAEMKEEEG